MIATAERVAELRRAPRDSRAIGEERANAQAIGEAHSHARRLRELSDMLEDDDPTALGVSGMRPTNGLMAFLADNECIHGRLPTDRTPPCGCYPTELLTPVLTPAAPVEAAPAPEPARTIVLSTKEARIMAATADPEAPHGRKKDGTPRLPPGRKPGKSPRKPTVSKQEASMITFDKIVEDTEAEFVRVTREWNVQQGVVAAAQAKLDELKDTQDRLADALKALKRGVKA